MTTLTLEQPIKLIENGDNMQAQKILVDLLVTDPHNLPAWYWYVKTYESIEERITAVKLCLKYNPENVQVQETLERLEEIIDESEVRPPTNWVKWTLSVVGILIAWVTLPTIAYTICGFFLFLGYILVSPMISWLFPSLRNLANTSW